jgi:hypothetical protein
MTVSLRHSHIDWQIGATLECNSMLEGKPPAPVTFRQSIDAKFAVKSARVKDDRSVV